MLYEYILVLSLNMETFRDKCRVCVASNGRVIIPPDGALYQRHVIVILRNSHSENTVEYCSDRPPNHFRHSFKCFTSIDCGIPEVTNVLIAVSMSITIMHLNAAQFIPQYPSSFCNSASFREMGSNPIVLYVFIFPHFSCI